MYVAASAAGDHTGRANRHLQKALERMIGDHGLSQSPDRLLKLRLHPGVDVNGADPQPVSVGHVDVSFRSLLLVCVSCLRVMREHERR